MVKNLFLEHKLKRRKTTQNYISFVEKLKRYSTFPKIIVSYKLNYTVGGSYTHWGSEGGGGYVILPQEKRRFKVLPQENLKKM